MNEIEKYPEGHFMGMWIGIGLAIFSGIGVPLSIATGNLGLIGIGPSLGIAFGAAIGQAIESKHRSEGRIRPLTGAEKRQRKIGVITALVILLLGVGLLITMLLR